MVAGFCFLNACAEALIVLILVDKDRYMTVPLAIYQTNRIAPDIRPHPGEIVTLSPDPAGIRLYDATTGAAIQ